MKLLCHAYSGYALFINLQKSQVRTKVGFTIYNCLITPQIALFREEVKSGVMMVLRYMYRGFICTKIVITECTVSYRIQRKLN